MSAGPAAAPGTGKRALFVAVLLLGLWVTAEALSALTLAVIDEGPGAAQARRDAVAAGAPATLAPGAGGARPATVAEEALHPYVGFVLNRDDHATCCHMNARGRSLLARRIGAANAAAEGRSR